MVKSWASSKSKWAESYGLSIEVYLYLKYKIKREKSASLRGQPLSAVCHVLRGMQGEVAMIKNPYDLFKL